MQMSSRSPERPAFSLRDALVTASQAALIVALVASVTGTFGALRWPGPGRHRMAA